MGIFFIVHSDKAQDSQARRAVQQSEWVKIYRGIYSNDLTTPIDKQIKSSIIPIVKHLCPNAMVSHRSAANLIVEDNTFFLTGHSAYRHELPGVTIIQNAGPQPQSTDHYYLGYPCSSEARYLLENLQIDRGQHKSLGVAWVEGKLNSLLEIYGVDRLNSIRDQSRVIAGDLGWEKQFKQLDQIIGALLGTRQANLATERARARARAKGEPFDEDRINLFEQFVLFLHRCDFKQRKAISDNELAFSNAAFWDAYFSNYIEGTVFDVSEAETIIFERREVEGRHEDSHHIIRSYDLLSSKHEMTRVHSNSAEWIDILCYFHRYFMLESSDKKPGEFKQSLNRAGNTVFVLPELVEGTLVRAYALLAELTCPVKRAMFSMFVVAEVHPFVDGNGRVARKMMNLELISADLERIIIPTAYRDDYLNGLRAVTHHQDFAAYCRMLDRAHYFTARFDYSDFDVIKNEFERIGAHRDDNQAILPAYNYRRDASFIPT